MSSDEKLANIMLAMNDKSFGQREAAKIVGSRTRLYKLIGDGSIRAEKPAKVQNGKWFCNAADVLQYARPHKY